MCKEGPLHTTKAIHMEWKHLNFNLWIIESVSAIIRAVFNYVSKTKNLFDL